MFWKAVEYLLAIPVAAGALLCLAGLLTSLWVLIWPRPQDSRAAALGGLFWYGLCPGAFFLFFIGVKAAVSHLRLWWAFDVGSILILAAMGLALARVLWPSRARVAETYEPPTRRRQRPASPANPAQTK